MPLTAATTSHRGIVLALLVAGASALPGQSRVTIDVTLPSINDRAVGVCRYTATRRYAAELQTPAPFDTVFVRVFTSDAFTDTALTPTALSVYSGTALVGTLAAGVHRDSFPVAEQGLADQVVSIKAPNLDKPLCAEKPLPVRLSAPIDPLLSRVDFAASGEVANALNTGGTAATTTGSLGARILSFADEGRDTTRFLTIPLAPVRGLVWAIGRLSVAREKDSAKRARRLGRASSISHRLLGPSIGLEDARFFISVAGTRDSLTGDAGGDFAQGVLSPLTASRKLASSVQISYSPMHIYNEGRQQVGLLGRFVANQTNWRPTGAPAAKQGVLTAFDARVRWVPVNIVSRTDNNNFSVALDGGFTQRNILSDASNDTTLLKQALATKRTRFEGLAWSLNLTLRNVTAFAEFQCLGCKVIWYEGIPREERVPQLEGLQPIVGFKFDAPFFSLPLKGQSRALSP